MTTTDQRQAMISALSAVAAAVIASASFVALREQYRGECLWIRWHPAPNASFDAKFTFVNFFALLFFACWILFGAEVGRGVGAFAKSSVNRFALAAIGAVIALGLYASVGLVTWNANPIPRNDTTSWKGTRVYLSVLWPIGLLQETGNYGFTFCGE